MSTRVEKFCFTAKEEDQNKRLDLFIADELQSKAISRSSVQKHIVDVLVNDRNEKKNYKIKEYDRIKFSYSNKDSIRVSLIAARASCKEERLDGIDIVYEDESLIVVNKPIGLVVHPAHGNYSNTLVHKLIDKLSNFDFAFDERPGIVHRLDKDTSGLMIVAKTMAAKDELQKAFYNREVRKCYKAIVKGSLLGTGQFDMPIKRHKFKRKTFTVDFAGKKALTLYNNISTYNTGNKHYSLLDIKTITGRTHQIRVHLSCAGYPIVGDSIYSRTKEQFEKKGLALFANFISFNHPLSKRQISFETDMPSHMKDIIGYIGHF